MKKICFVTTSPLIVNFFLRPHLLSLVKQFDVTLAVAQPGEVPLLPLPGIRVEGLCIRRTVAPLSDIVSLLKLVRLFRRHRFDLVHSVGPKAGLLAAVAGRMAGVPFRLHTFTGQVWANLHGFSRKLFRGIDRMTALFATNLLADSASQRQFLINEKTVPAKKIAVLASGSVNGVNLGRFKPNPRARTSLRTALHIDESDRVILFLGRMKRDKGVLDLADIIDSVVSEEPKTFFLFVGPDEGYLRKEIQKRALKSTKRISFLEYTQTPEDYLAASDILCLPSYREGFGSVIIESAACGIPTVASRIYGITDAVVDNVTGLLFEPRDIKDLESKLLLLVQSPNLCQQLGKAAQERAVSEFSEHILINALGDLYNDILSKYRE